MENERPEPKVGMGATMVFWTDRHAYTIIDVSPDLKTIKVQRDRATRIDKNGMSECQNYLYNQDCAGDIQVATLRKNGRYVLKGDSMKGTYVAIGHRREYYDYSF